MTPYQSLCAALVKRAALPIHKQSPEKLVKIIGELKVTFQSYLVSTPKEHRYTTAAATISYEYEWKSWYVIGIKHDYVSTVHEDGRVKLSDGFAGSLDDAAISLAMFMS
jgi:hypothetical protein